MNKLLSSLCLGHIQYVSCTLVAVLTVQLIAVPASPNLERQVVTLAQSGLTYTVNKINSTEYRSRFGGAPGGNQ